MPHVPGLRSSDNLVGGLVHFGRMIDKIRLHTRGELPVDCEAALGNGHDRVLSGFLQLTYPRIREHVLANPVATDEQLLEWVYQQGRRLGAIDLVVINGFLNKPTWRDESASNCPGWLVKREERSKVGRPDFDSAELEETRTVRSVSVL